MKSRRHCCTRGACPFAFNEVSEVAQSYGCLPTPFEIIVMKVKYNKTWACHDNSDKPCLGAIRMLKNNKIDYKQEGELITLDSDWGQYVKVTSEEHRTISSQLRVL